MESKYFVTSVHRVTLLTNLIQIKLILMTPERVSSKRKRLLFKFLLLPKNGPVAHIFKPKFGVVVLDDINIEYSFSVISELLNFYH